MFPFSDSHSYSPLVLSPPYVLLTSHTDPDESLPTIYVLLRMGFIPLEILMVLFGSIANISLLIPGVWTKGQVANFGVLGAISECDAIMHTKKRTAEKHEIIIPLEILHGPMEGRTLATVELDASLRTAVLALLPAGAILTKGAQALIITAHLFSQHKQKKSRKGGALQQQASIFRRCVRAS